MKIGIDLDGTILNMKKCIEELAEEHLGKKCKFIDVRTVIGLIKEEKEIIFDKYYRLVSVSVNEHADWFIHELKDKGYVIEVITGRPERYRDTVKEILDRKAISCNKLRMLKTLDKTDKKKAQLVNSSDVDIFIEDDEKQAIRMTKPVILLGHTFKKKNIVCVNDWVEIDRLFKKRCFSPGPVNIFSKFNINFSHRGEKFIKLYRTTSNLLKRKFGMDNYNVFFIQGSGTSAIESVISSLKKGSKLMVLSNGVFGERMVEICDIYHDYVDIVDNTHDLSARILSDKPDYLLYVDFETSMSKKNDLDWVIKCCKRVGTKVIADCVSSFGYCKTPDADIVITSSSKVIGAVPVLGIVFIKKGPMMRKICDNGFYLNLRRYIRYGQKGQTPSTSMIPQIYSLFDKLLAFNCLRNKTKIEENIKAFTTTLNTSRLVHIGDSRSHVLTYRLKKGSVDELYKRLLDYGLEIYVNKSYMEDCFQISCFSCMYPSVYRYLAVVLNCVLEEVAK